MANRFGTPIMFGMEKNIVLLYARATFGSGGAVMLDTMNSKGICNIAVNTPTFTASTINSSTAIGSVSSFQGIFSGMSVKDLTNTLQTNTTIGTVAAATSSLVFNKQSITTADGDTLVASGGQYLIQFGSQAGIRLDSYFKLLEVQHSFDMTTSSAVGTATVSQVAQAQLAPQNPSMLVIRDTTRVRTIPAVSTSASSDCTLLLQFGTGSGVNFVAGPPGAGEAIRLAFVFGNSSAI